MERCKTCKWWGYYINGEGEIKKLAHDYDDSRICGKLEDIDLAPTKRTDSISLSGGEYTHPSGPDFGCVHHEPKEDSNGAV